MTNTTNNPTTTWTVRLSANWMTDHLDVWEADCEAPQGTFKGNLWTGTVTKEQIEEIVDRCYSYQNPYGFEDGCEYLIRAARRTLRALFKQVPEHFQED